METNFFEGLAGLKFTGNLLLNIHLSESGEQTISVMAGYDDLKPGAVTLPPLLFKGTAAEIGAGFFAKLVEPLQATAGLFDNIAAYQKEVAKAQKQAADKHKTGKAVAAAKTADDGEDDDNADLFTPAVDDKAAKAEKKRLYDEAMDRVKTLAQQTKYTEALAQLPDPADYPDKAELLGSRRTDLEKAQKQYADLQKQFQD